MNKHRCPDTTDAAKIVIGFLGSFAMTGLIGSIWLVSHKVGGAEVAIVSGLCGTALGFLGGVLSQTKSSATPPTGTRSDPIAVEGSNPVLVTDTAGE